MDRMRTPRDFPRDRRPKGPGKTPIPFTVIHVPGPLPPIDAEFKRKEPTEVFAACGLAMGRCFGSKSAYRALHPHCRFLPNANVFSQKHGKVWWGDLDLQRDEHALERIAKRLRCRLYVVREFDGRFENATLPFHQVVLRAGWCTGGAMRPPVSRFLKEHKLTSTEAAGLLKMRESIFRRRLEPQQALELARRITWSLEGHLTQGHSSFRGEDQPSAFGQVCHKTDVVVLGRDARC